MSCKNILAIHKEFGLDGFEEVLKKKRAGKILAQLRKTSILGIIF